MNGQQKKGLGRRIDLVKRQLQRAEDEFRTTDAQRLKKRLRKLETELQLGDLT